jgi:hypothetical protein
MEKVGFFICYMLFLDTRIYTGRIMVYLERQTP